MAHVVQIQLALDVEIKRREGNKIFDFGDLALERVLVDRKIPVALDAHAHGIAVFHGLGLYGHHAADRSLDQTHTLVEDLAFFIRQLRLEHVLQHLVRVHQILADDDVERLFTPCPALAQAGDDIRHDELQNSCAHGGGHDVTRGNGLRCGLGVVAVDGGDVRDDNVLKAVARDIAHRIVVVALQGGYNRFGHIDEGDFIAGLAERCADKSAADVAAAVHNCFHLLFPSF